VIRAIVKAILGSQKLPIEIELVDVFDSGGQMYHADTRRMAYSGGDPSKQAKKEGNGILTHGASWRYNDDAMVITYVNVLDKPQSGRTPVKPYSTFDPSKRTSESVAAHAVEHLALLSERDPVISAQLSSSLKQALKKYTPSPAMELTKFRLDQKQDEHGRWTDDSDSGYLESLTTKKLDKIKDEQERNMSLDEMRTVREYTEDGFYAINKVLRGDRGFNDIELEKADKQIEHLKSSFNKHATPLEKPIVVARGIRGYAARRLLEDVKQGDVLVDDGFTSVSTNPEEATRFNKGFIAEIHFPAGKKFLVGRVDENEMIFDAGQRFRFDGEVESDDFAYRKIRLTAL
jgi:hypothetical protein